MQRRFPRKKLPTLSLPALSLYTEEEIEDVPTSSSPITKKSKNTRKGDINISEVSSTSEDTNQLPSTSSKSIFMDLYEEDIWDSGPDDVAGVKDNVTTVQKNTSKPGLSLLGEYTGSGNDTEEETLLSYGAKQKNPKETVDISTHKNSSPECTKSEGVNVSSENSTKLETGSGEFSTEIFLADDKLSLHEDDISDIDIHALLDDSLAKGDKSKEDNQCSGFESSDCQKTSDSTKKSEKQKEVRKDKSKPKNNKHVVKDDKTKDKGEHSGFESSDNKKLSDSKKDSKKLHVKEASKDKSKKRDSKHVAKSEKTKEERHLSGFKSSDNERLSDSRKDSKKLKEAKKDKSKRKDNKSLAKDDKSKEEGQLSESESSGSERLSDSRKDSKELKEARKDKSKKKKKKKKHKKHKQVTESKERSDGECSDDEEKKERKQKRSKSRSRSKSREISDKPKSLKRSRSRSRDRVSGRRRLSRSRSPDKRKKSTYHREKSRRSRSRSSSRRRSTSKRNKQLKSYPSRSRSRNRSTSPPNKRKGRRSSLSKTTPSRRKSPSSRKRKSSRSPSPRKHRGRSSEHKRSRSPKRHSRSPGKRRRTPEKKQKSPNNRLLSKKSASPNIKERKGSLSPARKLSHRTSSASDSLDSGHFTNIPLSNTNKVADDLVFDDKVAVQKSPLMKEQKEASIPPKSADLEKQRSPSCSPLVKAWGDDFDFVITERLPSREGTEKSLEDVLFGKEMADPKTPDFSRRTKESIKSSNKESQNVEKKKEAKDETLNGNKDIPVVCKENNVPQEVKTQQSGSSNLQSIPSNSVVKDKQSTSNSEDSKADISESKAVKTENVDTCKEDHVKKTHDNAASSHALDESDESAFLPSKLETIPFLDEAPPPAPPPVSGNDGHPNAADPSHLGLVGPPPVVKGHLPTPRFHGVPWPGLRSEASGMGLNVPKGSKDVLPTPGTVQKLYSNERDIDLLKKGKSEPFVTTKDKGKNHLDFSPTDMEISSPEGDIIDRLNEEFWKQQKQQWNQNSGRKAVKEEPEEVFVEPMLNEQSSFEEPYEPETGLLMNEDLEEDLNSIKDPKERRRKQKEKLKEKTKVQELIDKLHRQARVEEEVKHVLKVYYKHRDIDKEEYKTILRRAVPQVTNSGSSIDPERIRSLVKKYVAKIKGER